MNRNLKLAPTFYPRCLILSTAERLPYGVSTNARMITVQMERGDVNVKALTQAQERRHMFPYAMRAYTSWLAENYDSIMEQAREDMNAMRTKLRETGHARLPNVIAAMQAGISAFANFALRQGVLSVEEAKALGEGAETILIDLGVAQQQAILEARPATLFLETIIDMMRAGEVYLENVDEYETAPDRSGGTQSLHKCAGGDRTSARIGWLQDGVIHLLDAAMGEASTYLMRQGRHLPVSGEDLRRDLKDAGLLLGADQDRLKVRQRDPSGGKRVWITKVPAQALSQVAEEREINPRDIGLPPTGEIGGW